jgi:hypothetical protein
MRHDTSVTVKPNFPMLHNWRLLAPLALFFAVAVGRWLVWPAPSYDESEQLLHLQALSLGYGPQPPAFEWAYGAVDGFLPGDAYLKLLLLKAVLMAILYVGLIRFAQRTVGDQHASAAALLCLVCPQVIWESQRSLTHSLLLIVVLVMLISELLRLEGGAIGCKPGQQNGQTDRAPTGKDQIKRALVIGPLLAGLVLAKYSGPIVFLTLGLSLWFGGLISPMLIIRRWWKALLLSLGIAALLVLPHGLWALSAPQGPVEAVLSKISEQTTGDPTWMGFRTLAGGLVSVLGLPVLLALTAHALSRWARPIEVTEKPKQTMSTVPKKTMSLERFGLAQLTLTVGVGMTLVLAADVSFVKDRWLAAFLVLVPTALLAGVAKRGQPLLAHWLEKMALAILVVSSLALVFRGPIEASQQKLSWQTFDATAFKSRVSVVIDQADVVAVDTMQLAGQLRLLFPDRRVLLMPSASKGRAESIKGVCGQLVLIQKQFSRPPNQSERVGEPEQLRLRHQGSTQTSDYWMSTYGVDCRGSRPNGQ